MSICSVFFCVVGGGYLLWPVHSLGKTLLAFALLHSVLPRPNLPVTPGVSWLPTFAFQSPVMKRISFGGISYRRSCRSWENCSTWQLFNFSALLVGAQTWITLILNGFGWETNRAHSVVFEIASKYCISDSFVDYEGYSISFKGFLPTVVDIMVIWVKFTHSSPF